MSGKIISNVKNVSFPKSQVENVLNNVFYKFLVRLHQLHDEYNTSLDLWKHHVNLLLQSFRSVSSDIHQC